MFSVYFVAHDRHGWPILEELEGSFDSVPEAVYSFLELFAEEPACLSSAFVMRETGEIVATLTEVRRKTGADSWNEVVVVGPNYPDGERWETKWDDGEFLKRRVSVYVGV